MLNVHTQTVASRLENLFKIRIRGRGRPFRSRVLPDRHFSHWRTALSATSVGTTELPRCRTRHVVLASHVTWSSHVGRWNWAGHRFYTSVGTTTGAALFVLCAFMVALARTLDRNSWCWLKWTRVRTRRTKTIMKDFAFGSRV